VSEGGAALTGANLSAMSDTPGPPPALPEGLPDITGTLVGRMAIELVELSATRAVATMPVEGNTQPFGLLHGGASAVLAETLGSYAAQVHAGPGRVAVGIELSATHHRSTRAGVVRGTAEAVHLGSTLATYQVVVEDADGRRLCTARLTCMVIEARG
jgi:1,4-dihydroxy-2-naphthoyl-CoA hydrolase